MTKSTGTRVRRETIDYFIQKSREVHGNRYDYSKSVYGPTLQKVEIICPEHGSFWQERAKHCGKSKNGCPKCAAKKHSEFMRNDTDYFIERAKVVHGDRYDYSLTEYKHSEETLTIVCKSHGPFDIVANYHTIGLGCPSCVKPSNLGNTTRFSARASKKHSNKYSYDKVNYVDQLTPVTITCDIHGDFEQMPIYHMNGSGCRKCATEASPATCFSFLGLCELRPDFAESQGCLYIIRLENDSEKFIKVGVSSSFDNRCLAYIRYGFKVNTVGLYPMSNLESGELERKLLNFINKQGYKYKPKTLFSGRTECAELIYEESILNFVEDSIDE